MVTIVIPVSRLDFLRRIFDQLEFLECDRDRTNLFVYVDGNVQLYDKARVMTIESKFAERNCVYRAKGHAANVGSVRARRKRIAEIHNEIKELIKPCDHVFILEDDTFPPTTTLKRLLHHAAMHPHAGFISGVEIGRWGFEMIGAWTVDDLYDPKVLTTTKKGEGLQPIDAAGLYCCLIRYDVYKKHTFKPFADILGPDVDFGITMRQIGYLNYIDYDIHCRHLTKRGEITFTKANIVQVEIKKTDNGWSQKQV